MKDNIIGASNLFAHHMDRIGMELSEKKNLCNASSWQLASDISKGLVGLSVKIQQRVKSLGGALGAGKWRNTLVQKKRLEAFNVRKVGFANFAAVLGPSDRI